MNTDYAPDDLRAEFSAWDDLSDEALWMFEVQLDSSVVPTGDNIDPVSEWVRVR